MFASDAISSTAYATDEIVVVLLIQAGIGAEAFATAVPIAVIVCVLLVIVVMSYHQTIMAYPCGGGAYIVSRENLGITPSLVAGASLLVDYILTVAVSVAGGVLAIRTATGFDPQVDRAGLPGLRLRHDRDEPARREGVRCAFRRADVLLHPDADHPDRDRAVPDLRRARRPDPRRALARSLELVTAPVAGPFIMLLRAFSSGAVALSGVEAVSNGVPAFRKPESKNAATTLMWMGVILGTCFLGVSILAVAARSRTAARRDGNGLGLMAEYLYGGKGLLFWLTQIATFAILILAANTAYADFPRLSSIVARDGFLPRQFANRGDRLVFSNGVHLPGRGGQRSSSSPSRATSPP